MAFKIKKVTSVTYILIDLTNKPDWFTEVNPAKTAPALQFGDRTITESAEMVEYLDSTYPSPSLKPNGSDEATEVTGNVFNLFSAWAKHYKESGAAQAEATFTAELQKIDNFLQKQGGPFLCGPSWSVADCSLVPRLYHITTVAEHYLNYSKHKSMTNLSKYMEHTFSTPEFKATDYPREWVLLGWAKYFN